MLHAASLAHRLRGADGAAAILPSMISIGSTVRDFLRLEAAGGILLFVGALAALLCANSPLDLMYAGFLDTPMEVRVGAFHIAKPLLLWINDGLMSVFFLLVGLELKREMLEGRLSRRRRSRCPRSPPPAACWCRP